MKVDTKQRKKARKGFAQMYGDEELATRMVHVLQVGKKGLDSLVMDLGRMLAETIMDIERCHRVHRWPSLGRGKVPAGEASALRDAASG